MYTKLMRYTSSVNTVGREISDDHVSDNTAILHIEQRGLAFALAATREVVAAIATIEHRPGRHDMRRGELHGCDGCGHGAARIVAEARRR